MVAFGNYDFVKQNLFYTSTQFNGIAGYSLYWVLSLVDYFDYTGDRQTFDRLKENACSKLDIAYEHYGKSPDLQFFGWDERLGAGFENPNCPESQNAYKMLSLRAWNEFSRAARAVGYENAGTVEFLLDPDMEHFYFMEMNTRIQVEHGVTEMITGVDLVRQQLRIASGLPLDLTQEDVTLTGHAIECRINAEDPARNFQPCPGHVEFLHFPGGTGVRVDSCLYSGCELSPYYDSLAAKVMVHSPTRLEAIRRMRRCLEEFTLEGFPTNAELSYELLFHPTFVRGGCTTAFLDRSLPELLEFSRRVDDHKG